MEIDGRRRSDNFEDRGRGSGGGGLPSGALFAVLSRLGLRGALIVGLLLLGLYFFVPGARAPLLGMLGLSGGSTASSGHVCDTEAQACDFSRAILASTEDVWSQIFQEGRLPNYGTQPGAYTDPKLVVFSQSVDTGCGAATSDVGPFYCPNDGQLYIDPSFYQTMQDRLHAPGDFAQAYVIAHEVGHHVQKLIGAMNRALPGESENQTSVRTELQADCFAGVWGHTAQASLQIDDADLREALNAAHNIGDDTLGAQQSQYTHGTSAQRMSWFRRGFDSGDPRQCDTWSVPSYDQL
jgi:predicted metalloprotease